MSPEDPRRFIEQLYEEVFHQKNPDTLAKYYAPEWIIHRPWGTERFEDVERSLPRFYSAFPDIRMGVEDLYVVGDTLVARCSLRGTNSGAVPGFGTPGNRMDQWWIEIDRLENGKIVETWSAWDRQGVLG